MLTIRKDGHDEKRTSVAQSEAGQARELRPESGFELTKQTPNSPQNYLLLLNDQFHILRC